MSAEECIMAAKLQNQYPNKCKLSSSGHFGSKFVTVVVTGLFNVLLLLLLLLLSLLLYYYVMYNYYYFIMWSKVWSGLNNELLSYSTF